jgi:hypothetical protein
MGPEQKGSVPGPSYIEGRFHSRLERGLCQNPHFRGSTGPNPDTESRY